MHPPVVKGLTCPKRNPDRIVLLQLVLGRGGPLAGLADHRKRATSGGWVGLMPGPRHVSGERQGEAWDRAGAQKPWSSSLPLFTRVRARLAF
jgi:hypothetical protein